MAAAVARVTEEIPRERRPLAVQSSSGSDTLSLGAQTLPSNEDAKHISNIFSNIFSIYNFYNSVCCSSKMRSFCKDLFEGHGIKAAPRGGASSVALCNACAEERRNFEEKKLPELQRKSMKCNEIQ